MAMTFLARMKVYPHKVDDFIALCKRMEADVARLEPDCLAYKFYRLREPYGFAVLESFRTEAAEEFHRTAPHSAAVIDEIVACLDGGYHREFLDDLDAAPVTS